MLRYLGGEAPVNTYKRITFYMACDSLQTLLIVNTERRGDYYETRVKGVF